jgi:hypothetical protein
VLRFVETIEDSLALKNKQKQKQKQRQKQKIELSENWGKLWWFIGGKFG